VEEALEDLELKFRSGFCVASCNRRRVEEAWGFLKEPSKSAFPLPMHRSPSTTQAIPTIIWIE
jgi:hypothetical protein